jgi:signal peptidase I
MKLRWFFSSSVRQASDMAGHVRRLLNAQRDILSPQAVEAVSAAIRDTRAALDANADADTLRKKMSQLEEVAGKWIKPYPNAEWRENIEVFLVAIAVAMSIRTFFLQPFKIPTGSMEPTLYGIECQDLRHQPGFKMPNALERFWDVIYRGAIYHEVIAPADGEVVRIDPLGHVFSIINRETIWVQYRGQSGAVPLTIWCGPDESPYGRTVALEQATGLMPGSTFNKGEPVFRFQEVTGDHLFVDRVTYNFRRPGRGDIVVFKTQGIPLIHDQTQFYIKRLIGLPGEKVSIGEDQHVRINGHRLDASTPHFQNVYGFNPNIPPQDGVMGFYNGHILQDRPESFLRTSADSLDVPPGNYVVFGDNTRNSSDSRYWQWLPQDNVIGRSSFVYWPVTPRFGWNSINW